MRTNNQTTENAFFALLRAGLWEQSVRLSPYEPVDFEALFEMADYQSVVGLLAAGLELVLDRKVTKPEALPFLKKVFSIENRNAEMNSFIESLVGKMRTVGIYALLVKGQGIAQCYERPQWRSPGDIDLLLSNEDYKKAKSFLIPRASFVDKEYEDRMHLAMTIDSFSVELHGSLRSNRLGRVNDCIDDAHDDTFRNGHVRVWVNGNTDIFLPAEDNDIIFVFTHILQHFFTEGIGLRQICDWCRLLWSYREKIDGNLLSVRLRKARLTSEWRVFAALAVNNLGMPMNAMPLFQQSKAIDRKARRLMKYVLQTGNFGQHRMFSCNQGTSELSRRLASLANVTRDTFYRIPIFPVDAMTFYIRYVFFGSKSALKEV